VLVYIEKYITKNFSFDSIIEETKR